MSSADILPPPSKTRYLTVPDTAAKKDSLKQYSVDEVKQVSARTFPAFRSCGFHARPDSRGPSASRRRSCSDEKGNGPSIWLETLAAQLGDKGSEARRYRTRQSTEAEGAHLSPSIALCIVQRRYVARKQNNAAVLATNSTAPYTRAADADLAHSPPA